MVKSNAMARPATVEKRQKTRVENKLNITLNNKVEYRTTEKVQEVIETINQIEDVAKFLDEAPITCHWAGHRSINIEFNGTVHPCCHMNRGMYFPNDPESKFYYDVDKLYEPNWNKLSNHKLKEIMDHDYFRKDLQDSWKPDTDPDKKFKRLLVCVETCTKKLDKELDEVVETR